MIASSGGYDLPELVVNKDDLCTFIILDENLQRFPFESMYFILDRVVSRIPSIDLYIVNILEANTGDFLEPFRTEDKGRSVPRINPPGQSMYTLRESLP